MSAPIHTKIEKRILKSITPASKPLPIVAQVIKKVEQQIKKRQILATVVLGGSLAKGTYLKGDHDVDVFVRFAPEHDDAKLADLLESILKQFKPERVHGSRDYFHVYAGSFTFEFIPVLNITSWQEARNVTDMSPLHVGYVKEKIEERPWLSDEIRLTKQFCKAGKVYGAESYIGGFSGHVIDLLNIYYGGFRQLLEAAAKWPAKVVIDPEKKLDNPMTQLNEAKVYAPIVIVDPVQQDRNSAAAVTEFAFKKFKELARAYLESGNEDFFKIIPLNINEIKKRNAGEQVIVVELVPQKGKKDVIGAKCYKVFQHCVQHLVENNFPLIESLWEFTEKKATLVFVVKKGLLSEDEEIAGPPIHKTVGVANFAAVHKTTFSRDGVMYAIEKRKFRDAKKLLQFVLKQSYVKERVKSAKLKNA